MPKIAYVERRFSSASADLIEKANEIVADYQKQGFVLTLRQLYYQFVARGLLENSVRNYKRLGSVVNDARLAGLVDWDAIEDRTRGLDSLAHWQDAADIVGACASQFRLDKWEDQPHRLEIWIEKEALAGVFAGVCRKFDVPFLSCRGYTSQSEMWRAAERLKRFRKHHDQKVVVLHFGDHDPSGIDMSRDIRDRLDVFGCKLEFHRLALNMDQVERFNPPPNPAKETDSRFAGYIERFGDKSWELDALEPSVLVGLATTWIERYRDLSKWNRAIERENEYRKELHLVAQDWDAAVDSLTEDK